ncbi:MAG: NAD-dependent epimerase/dehydratase family protein [Flexilinea sp.]|jgi:nucleoside-diphosphate-sugar epimerase
MKSILVTGACGLVGSDLVLALQKKYGENKVIAMDVHPADEHFQGIMEVGDVCDLAYLRNLVKKHDVKQIYHLAGLLSMGGEKNPDRAWKVNLGGLKNILDIAKDFQTRVFWPSSIAVFGETTPKENVPQHSSFEPTTMYGITKVSGELLCKYYFHKYGVDVRSLRFPGLNGYKAAPGDGTTEYAIHIFYGLIKENRYECFLKEDARLPMMYMDDAIRGTIALMEAPAENISIRTSYNFTAVSFTPAELVAEIRKISPDFEITYKPDDRQLIAESWAQTIDDSTARKDWNWQEEFDLPKMTEALYKGVKERLENV